MEVERIRIALQKSGRLADDSLSLLTTCGLHIARSRDQLFCRVQELPIDVLLVRDDDLPSFVNSGICDLGIVGENVFAEAAAGQDGFSAKILDRLGFSICRLSIAVPESGPFRSVSDLEGSTIATSYPRLLNKYLVEKAVNNVKTVVMTGSVEIAPRLKIADGICDIVASGATLTANGLRELTVILKSEALLIRSAPDFSPEKEQTVHRLLNRMRGALMAEDSKYIMLNAPRSAVDRIAKLLPGCDSPTIVDLNRQGMVAIHAVCKEAVFWDTMEEIKAAGGSAILVLPIEKMMS